MSEQHNFEGAVFEARYELLDDWRASDAITKKGKPRIRSYPIYEFKPEDRKAFSRAGFRWGGAGTALIFATPDTVYSAIEVFHHPIGGGLNLATGIAVGVIAFRIFRRNSKRLAAIDSRRVRIPVPALLALRRVRALPATLNTLQAPPDVIDGAHQAVMTADALMDELAEQAWKARQVGDLKFTVVAEYEQLVHLAAQAVVVERQALEAHRTLRNSALRQYGDLREASASLAEYQAAILALNRQHEADNRDLS